MAVGRLKCVGRTNIEARDSLKESQQYPREKPVRVNRVTTYSVDDQDDAVAVEEPLEIRVVFGPEEKRRSKSLSITMRTPGNDFELAAGFLLSESVVSHPDQIIGFEHVGPAPDDGEHGNTLVVELGYDVPFEIENYKGISIRLRVAGFVVKHPWKPYEPNRLFRWHVRWLWIRRLFSTCLRD